MNEEDDAVEDDDAVEGDDARASCTAENSASTRNDRRSQLADDPGDKGPREDPASRRVRGPPVCNACNSLWIIPHRVPACASCRSWRCPITGARP